MEESIWKIQLVFADTEMFQPTIQKWNQKYTTLYWIYIKNYNVVNFLSRGMGNFDAICENQVLILKKKLYQYKNGRKYFRP